MSAHDVVVVLVTVPEREVATRIATELINHRLAACINILSGCHSIYRWKGQIESADEVLMLIKSRRARFDDLAAAITAGHPYDVPEIVAVTPEAIAPAYAAFLDENMD